MTQRDRYLATILFTDIVGSTEQAALELALGYRERALERIERAERERELDIVPFQLDQRLDPLRSDSRFRRVVERMGPLQDDRRGDR